MLGAVDRQILTVKRFPLVEVKGLVGIESVGTKVGIVGYQYAFGVVISSKDEDVANIFVGMEPSFDKHRNIVGYKGFNSIKVAVNEKFGVKVVNCL